MGLQNGRLRKCPDSPNCVCSQDEDAAHCIEPLRFTDEPTVAWNRLIELVRRQSRVRIVECNEGYLHAEFTTKWFRFVDDVEFLLDASGSLIHVRSASRIGYSDLGLNRRRIEAIRAQL